MNYRIFYMNGNTKIGRGGSANQLQNNIYTSKPNRIQLAPTPGKRMPANYKLTAMQAFSVIASLFVGPKGVEARAVGVPRPAGSSELQSVEYLHIPEESGGFRGKSMEMFASQEKGVPPSLDLSAGKTPLRGYRNGKDYISSPHPIYQATPEFQGNVTKTIEVVQSTIHNLLRDAREIFKEETKNLDLFSKIDMEKVQKNLQNVDNLLKRVEDLTVFKLPQDKKRESIEEISKSQKKVWDQLVTNYDLFSYYQLQENMGETDPVPDLKQEMSKLQSQINLKQTEINRLGQGSQQNHAKKDLKHLNQNYKKLETKYNNIINDEASLHGIEQQLKDGKLAVDDLAQDLQKVEMRHNRKLQSRDLKTTEKLLHRMEKSVQDKLYDGWRPNQKDPGGFVTPNGGPGGGQWAQDKGINPDDSKFLQWFR